MLGMFLWQLLCYDSASCANKPRYKYNTQLMLFWSGNQFQGVRVILFPSNLMKKEIKMSDWM